VSLRVATLNIWGTNGPWRRLELIRQELSALRPDVVGMQEVTRSRDLDQAVAIAEGLGYVVAYGPADVRGKLALGNTLLSRLPLTTQWVLPLPVGGWEPRSVLSVLVDGRVQVFVTHLNWQPDHSAIRVEQVRFILALAPPASVVMGDFNAQPDSPEIALMRGYADAWVAAGDGTAGATFSRDNDYAREGGGPSRRLDYVFTRGKPVRAELAFHRPVDGVWPSDHFGLVADIDL
jgi:endonuclease/exonuclease/phosphatase family metal-dependent hydrolase